MHLKKYPKEVSCKNQVSSKQNWSSIIQKPKFDRLIIFVACQW